MTSKISGIYCIENKTNGKKYIGKSKNIYKRWISHKSDLRNASHCNIYLQRAWDKYGEEHFNFYILEEVQSEYLDKTEMYYIKKNNTTDKDFGYNLCGNIQYEVEYNNDTIQNMRLVQKSIPVLQLDYKGVVINSWSGGARHASKDLGLNQSSIWNCCRGNLKTYKKSIWIYKDDYNKETFDIRDYLSESQKVVPIVQLDLDGNFIMEYDSPKQANQLFGFSSNTISKCIRGKTNTHKGFYWVKKYDYLDGNYELKTTKKTRFIQFSRDMEQIRIWDNIEDVCFEFNISASTIRKACSSGRIACGFRWEYLK